MSEELSRGEQERIARAKQAHARKIKKIITWVIVLGVIVAAIYGLVAWSKNWSATRPGTEIPEMASRDHINVGAQHEAYSSNPPTSGPHYAAPANWGVYAEQLPDEQLVHNLEHGGIWISYKDPGHTELINQLKSIVDEYALKVIMTPRPENSAPIEVAAWGRLLTLSNFDEQQIRDFIGAFINRGPEQVPY